jgi:flagellar hook assembly protein FlgD
MFAGVRSGESIFTWDGRDDNGALISDGIYFCQLETSNKRITRKMTVVR